MNKFVIYFAVSVACAMAAPCDPEVEALRKLPALEHKEIHDELGQFSLRYVTAEGTIVVEKGRLIPNPDGEGMVMVVEGEVTYIGDDGITYTSKYNAGVNGYEVTAAHIPVGPSLPPVPAVPAVPADVPEVEVLSMVV